MVCYRIGDYCRIYFGNVSTENQFGYAPSSAVWCRVSAEYNYMGHINGNLLVWPGWKDGAGNNYECKWY